MSLSASFQDYEEALYNLSTDAEELSPMGIDSALMEELEYYWSTPPLVISPIVSDDAVDINLRDLGYIN